MIFIDEARIFVKAGDGGKGCESFYSDKRTRYPRPDGGNGGKGGGIVFVADRHVQTLMDFKYKQHYKADRGGNGSSKGKKGRDGKDCILLVPTGTILTDMDTGTLIKDLVLDQQSVVVAKGGPGGIGNIHRKVLAHRKALAPPGQGEQRTIRLELKLIADVGLVGFPNAGKSTIISNISKVKSKIANYPFTTKQPILGIVQDDDVNFVVADLPGIIEGAHKGKGLGDRFLRHAERTKILVHVIDMAGSEGRDPLEDYEKIEAELEQYSDALMIKDRILAANKMDLPEASDHLKKFQKKYKKDIIPISALEKKGLDRLIQKIKDMLCCESSRER